jgi:hypothetical protein
MKRALAVCTVLAVLGFSAFGIGTFSGNWSATVKLLPSPSLISNSLTINYTDFGWTFTGVLNLTGTAADTFQFTAKGAFGPLSLTANEWFSVPNAEWMGGDLATSLDFAGLSLGLTVRHWDKDYADFFYTDNAPWYAWVWYPDEEPCQTYNNQAGMMYILTATVAPVDLKVRFLDCSFGIAFYDTVITLKDLGLCCGISLDVEVAFDKEHGFEYADFTGIEIPLCCGVSFVPEIKFYPNSKVVSTGLKFAGFGDACFTVYGDAIKTGNAWTGIDIYGWKIKCSLGDCNYIEFLTALNVDKVEEIVGDIFTGNEFEYMKLGFCGAGCCGGKYTVTLYAYFNNVPGTLFGLNRIRGVMTIPVMSNLSFTVDFRDTLSTSAVDLRIGWTFTF